MSIDVQSRARFNLKDAQILLVVHTAMDMDILAHILVGIGGRDITKCETAELAKAQVARGNFDLIIADAFLGGEDGLDLVSWIRRSAPEPNRYAPVILISAHTQASRVAKARDCGAHCIVAKPLTPIVLIQRIFWVAREARRFVKCDTYEGPDRRFKYEGPPPGEPGRRADDLNERVGLALEPNMSQDAIDALVQPRKVSL